MAPELFSRHGVVARSFVAVREGFPGTGHIGEELPGRVVLRIADTGRGIAAKDHARAFELFRRAGAQDKPGGGIGLAHVKAVARSLGGRIELASTPGVGTTFTITLPKAVRKAGLGTRVVGAMAKNLGSAVNFEPVARGTCVRISFPA